MPINEMRHFYETKWLGSLFLGGGGTPGGDGEELVDDVVGFTATIWAPGEGGIIGGYAVGEIEGAADLPCGTSS